MRQDQSGLKRLSDVGIVFAFGLITMSSNIANSSIATNTVPNYTNYSCLSYSDETVCNSALLTSSAIGDIVTFDNDRSLEHRRRKITANMYVTKVVKHTSFFDFDDVYEEL